jgi:hypothetical protein
MSVVVKEFRHEPRIKSVVEHVGREVVQNRLIAGFENSDFGAHDCLSRSIFEPGDDRGDQCGGVFTRHRNELLVAGLGLPVGTVSDASHHETRHAELAARLDDGGSLHFNGSGTKSVPEHSLMSGIRQEYITRHDHAFDDPWLPVLASRDPNRRQRQPLR